MNTWAAQGKYDCNFLCVCVVGGPTRGVMSLVREMSQTEKLTHCVNGFVDDESEMPTIGQLGCQGFIILDANQKVVTSATSPFMQVRGLAFEHVEALLDSLCQQKPLPPVCPGELIELMEAPPSHPQLAGSRGICIKYDGDEVHFGFETGPLRGRAMRIAVSKVRKLEDESEDEHGGGGCSTGTCGVPAKKSNCGGGDCGSQGTCGKSDCKSAVGGACSQNEGLAGLAGLAVPAGLAALVGLATLAALAGLAELAALAALAGLAALAARAAFAGPSAGGKSPSPALDSAFIAEALNLVSVNVPSMDAEHVQCAVALRQLAEEGSRTALEQVLTCLGAHFAHEEALFEQFGFGEHKNEKLSAKKTHIEDHKRILSKIQQQLAVPAGGVSAEFVGDLLRDFHEHTSRYDTKYGDVLSEKGAQ